jgi:cell division protein FtsN
LVLGAAGWYFRDTWQGWLNGGNQTKVAKTEKSLTVPGDTIKKEKTTTKADSTTSVKDTLQAGSAAEKQTEKAEPAKARQTQQQPKTHSRQAASGEYMIIAGCFRSEQNAEEYVQELRTKGFDASIQGQTPQGLQKVVYGVYVQKSEALSELRKIRQKENSGAWLDKK